MSVYTKFSNECKFGIKSGGHTPQKGAANQQNGVTIDLGAFKQVQVSADRKKTSIGPGNRWADVYSKLDAQGIAIPGGRVASVGVGGLITGGGVSFFSGRFGFVCDSIINYELVLPYGKVVNVNASSSPDLFKALKGGSNNFGIVTRFDIKSFESGPFWGGVVVYPLSTMPEQVTAFVNLGTLQPCILSPLTSSPIPKTLHGTANPSNYSFTPQTNISPPSQPAASPTTPTPPSSTHTPTSKETG